MEDILSSIKRIIAEEGDAPPARPRRGQRIAAAPPPTEREPAEADDIDDAARDEVLELNDPMPIVPSSFAEAGASLPSFEISAPADAEVPPAMPAPKSAAPNSSTAAVSHTPPAAEPASPIVSQQTAAATRGSLDSLSRLLVKPEPASDGTLEGLVREMLRPMLRDWLDANLPPMVEAMVAREIAKITGQAG